jgi:hypothetical protein
MYTNIVTTTGHIYPTMCEKLCYFCTGSLHWSKGTQGGEVGTKVMASWHTNSEDQGTLEYHKRQQSRRKGHGKGWALREAGMQTL